MKTSVLAVVSAILLSASILPAEPAALPTTPNKRVPKEYLAIFINGYAADALPKDPAQFEKLLLALKNEGHFNAVLAQYSPQREELCKKHGMYLFVDLLAYPHVYNNPKECEELLKKLQDSPTIGGYHVWSDRFGAMGAGRARDIDHVHKWDPNHGAFSGTYNGAGLGFLAKATFVSNYDFHWKRGPDKNFRNLMGQWNAARPHDGRLGRYCTTDAGLAGKGNYNRLLHTQTTSIACGLRAAMWHIGSRIMNMGSFQFNGYGKDLAKVNEYIAPMRGEIAKIGLPYAIYSTPWTKNYNNQDVPQPATGKAMPPGLEKNAIPADFWLQAQAGEFVMGVSKYSYTDKDVVFITNHNAYAGQDVKVKLTKASVKPKLFSRSTGKYEDLPLADGAFTLKLDAAGAAIVLFE
ncbi:MAG: hypothetical protein LLG01_19615 [Planctomycetaceae bacterium]|nr:hypothetical protein [Planctomycetaceae bacterium]